MISTLLIVFQFSLTKEILLGKMKDPCLWLHNTMTLHMGAILSSTNRRKYDVLLSIF